MLDPRKYPEEVKECWSIHQVLRAIGYPADNIYLALAKDQALPFDNSSLFVVLKANRQEFIVTLQNYKTENEARKIMDVWTEFVRNANAQKFDQEILNEIFQSSNVMRNKIEFLHSLQRKGFRVGRLMQDWQQNFSPGGGTN